jgi:hypothetical protein
MKGARGEEAQGVARAFEGCGLADPLAIGRDTNGSQTKTSGGDACNILVTRWERRAVHAGSIGHQAGLWICLLPEVTKRPLLKVVNESFKLLRRRDSRPEQNEKEKERREGFP